MDNQQNQFDSPTPGDDIRVQNAGSTSPKSGIGASNPSESGSTGSASRKANAGSTASARSNQDAAGASGQSEGQQPNANAIDSVLESGKKWIEDSGVLNSVNDLPKQVKGWSSRAASRVGDLTTTQKIVGGALLAVGIGYLATRKGKSSKGSAYNYGRSNKDSGSYGRSSSSYQAPDAANSRRVNAGSGRSDSGSPYGNSGSQSNSGKYSAGSSFGSQAGSRSADSGAGFGSSDQGSRTSESSFRAGKSDESRGIE